MRLKKRSHELGHLLSKLWDPPCWSIPVLPSLRARFRLRRRPGVGAPPPGVVTSAPIAEPSKPPSAPGVQSQSPINPALLGGLAWLLCAAAIGYLGLLQLGYVGTVVDEGSLQAIALWNFLSAGLTLYFGARLITRPTKGILGTSALFALVTVLWQAYNISLGATHETYLISTVAAGMAGILSVAARRELGSSTPTP
jgi:hypothetical protein